MKKMMNKSGKGKGWLIAGAIALIFVALMAGIAFFTPTSQQTIGGTGNVVAPVSGNGVNIYTQPLALSYSGSDKLQAGTPVTATIYKRAVGNTLFSLASNPDSVSQGTKFDVLFVNNTVYHNAYLTGYTAPSKTADTLEVQLYKTSALSMRVFNTDSQRMTNLGGVNQSVTLGGAYNLQVFMDGQDKTSTQDMVCVLEGDTSKIQQVTLSGGSATYKGMAKPSSYVLGSVNSGVWVYDVAPITGANSVSFTLGATSKTGQTMAGKFFKISCFTKEYFIDAVTGSVAYGIEDSNGVLKSLGTYEFTGYFQ